jgi:hypothetical protein
VLDTSVKNISTVVSAQVSGVFAAFNATFSNSLLLQAHAQTPGKTGRIQVHVFTFDFPVTGVLEIFHVQVGITGIVVIFIQDHVFTTGAQVLTNTSGALKSYIPSSKLSKVQSLSFRDIATII